MKDKISKEEKDLGQYARREIPLEEFLKEYVSREEVREVIDRLQKDVAKQRNDQAIGWHNGLEELKKELGL